MPVQALCAVDPSRDQLLLAHAARRHSVQWKSFQLECRPMRHPTFKNVFSGAAAFNGDLSRWDVSQGSDFSYMFSFAAALNPFNEHNCQLHHLRKNVRQSTIIQRGSPNPSPRLVFFRRARHWGWHSVKHWARHLGLHSGKHWARHLGWHWARHWGKCFSQLSAWRKLK